MQPRPQDQDTTLPVPRLEALVFCFSAGRDARGAITLEGIGDAVVVDPIPGRISGSVFVRYAAGAADHGVGIRVVQIDTGQIVFSDLGRSSSQGHGAPITSVVPVTIDVPKPGRYAIQLLVDGDILGSALLNVRSR
jgi:hypothetical protein